MPQIYIRAPCHRRASVLCPGSCAAVSGAEREAQRERGGLWMQVYGEDGAEEASGNAPEVVNAVNAMAQFCQQKIEAIGETRRIAAQTLYGKSQEEVNRMVLENSTHALVHYNARVQRAVMAPANRSGSSSTTMPCRSLSGPMILARYGRMQSKMQRDVKEVVRAEKDRLAQIARLEKSQEAAMRKADAQEEKEEKRRQREAAKRAKQQAAARKKRAAARAKLMRQREKERAAAAKAGGGSDILAMPELGQSPAWGADAGVWEEEDDEEEECQEEEEDVGGDEEDGPSASAERVRATGVNWTEAEESLSRQIETLEQSAGDYDAAMRAAISEAVSGEQAFVTDLANAIPGLATSGNAYAKELKTVGVTALKASLLPDAPLAHARVARIAAMRQSEEGGRRGASVCPTSGADHGSAVHESMQRISAAILTSMRGGVPRDLDPCVVPIMAALRARQLVLVGAEVPVIDLDRAASTRIDMVCVSARPGDHGAVVLVELKTGSAGCFDVALPGDPVITFTDVPGGSGPTQTRTERCSPLLEARLQHWLTLAMLQGSTDEAHGVRCIVMHLPDRYGQVVCYTLPKYMYDADATKAMYTKAMQAQLEPTAAARLGFLAKAPQA